MPVVESPIGHLTAVTEAQAVGGQTFKIDRLEADGSKTIHLAVCQNDSGWLVRWYKDADGRLQYSEYRLKPGPNERAARGNEVAEKPKVPRPTIEQAMDIINQHVPDGIGLNQLQQVVKKFRIGPETAKNAMQNLISRGLWEQGKRRHGGFAFSRINGNGALHKRR